MPRPGPYGAAGARVRGEGGSRSTPFADLKRLEHGRARAVAVVLHRCAPPHPARQGARPNFRGAGTLRVRLEVTEYAHQLAGNVPAFRCYIAVSLTAALLASNQAWDGPRPAGAQRMRSTQLAAVHTQNMASATVLHAIPLDPTPPRPPPYASTLAPVTPPQLKHGPDADPKLVLATPQNVSMRSDTSQVRAPQPGGLRAQRQTRPHKRLGTNCWAELPRTWALHSSQAAPSLQHAVGRVHAGGPCAVSKRCTQAPERSMARRNSQQHAGQGSACCGATQQLPLSLACTRSLGAATSWASSS